MQSISEWLFHLSPAMSLSIFEHSDVLSLVSKYHGSLAVHLVVVPFTIV
jgi:hypothetical protein